MTPPGRNHSAFGTPNMPCRSSAPCGFSERLLGERTGRIAGGVANGLMLNAFHENAVYVKRQFAILLLFFAVVLPKTYLPFLAEHFAEWPGAVKGAFCAAQRTLDGEDSATLPLGGKVGRCALDNFVRSNAGCPKPFLALRSMDFSVASLNVPSLSAAWQLVRAASEISPEFPA